MKRMSDSRLPKKICEWMPKGGRKRERRKRKFEDEVWEDRDGWRVAINP